MKTKSYAFEGYTAKRVYGGMESDTLIAVCVVIGAASKEAAQVAAQSAMICAKTNRGVACKTPADANRVASFWASRGKKLVRVDMNLQREIGGLLLTHAA